MGFRRHPQGRKHRLERRPSVIEIEGGTAEQRTIFYTALYHSMLAPNVFSDVDGRYRGMDRQIHQAQDRQHYTVFSLWDTFRATHPLFTIIEPTRTVEFVNTFLAQYEQGGMLPVWELAGNETGLHDRLPLGAGDRRRLGQGHSRLRRRPRAESDEAQRRPPISLGSMTTEVRLHRRRRRSRVGVADPRVRLRRLVHREKGQRRVREILDTLYSNAPDGLSGNEDCGQMSSWYVLSAVGLYPVNPGSPDYVIGAPLFPKVTINLENGPSFVIRSVGNGDSGVVRSARLNDHPISRSFLRHEEIAAGGVLELELGDSSDSEWGRNAADRPRSRVAGDEVVPAPYAVADADTFRDQLTIDLESAAPQDQIRYTIGEQPSLKDGALWSEPQVVEHPTTVHFRAEVDGRFSPTVSSTFHKIRQQWSIEILCVPNSQYTAGGPDALVDGIRGPEDWRLGGWQGYQDTDFEAVIDLGEVQPISRAGAGFMQDVRSWIWMPTEVVIWISEDGLEFREAARVANQVPDDSESRIRHDLVAELEDIEVRFLKIYARNYSAIPDWHPGHGGQAFIFIDEILVE